MSDFTRLLNAIDAGDSKAADQLLPLVYEELRKLAAAKMAQEQPGQTLQPTALVHEAWLRLSGGENVRFDGRGHFFAAAAEAMRRILIDRARQKRSLRRGAGAKRVNLNELEVAVAADDDTLLAGGFRHGAKNLARNFYRSPRGHCITEQSRAGPGFGIGLPVGTGRNTGAEDRPPAPLLRTSFDNVRWPFRPSDRRKRPAIMGRGRTAAGRTTRAN